MVWFGAIKVPETNLSRKGIRPLGAFLDPESGEDAFEWVVGQIRG